jgi:hypothetical protein
VRTPVRLDNGKLVAFLGVQPQTSLADAVRVTLKAPEAPADGRSW